MGTGKIDHDRSPNCHKCDQPWGKKDVFDYEIPYCESCKTYPTKYRLRKYIPSSDGNSGFRADIRYDKHHKRITDPKQAVMVMSGIDQEIESGTFDPKEYESREYAKNFTLENFLNNTYFPRQEAEKELGNLSPEMLRKKRGYARNHIIPALGGEDIRQITGPMITNFYYKLKHIPRQMSLVTNELRVILTKAVEEGIIDKLPNFPKLQQSQRRDPEETRILTMKEQNEVISKIDNPIYAMAITMLTIYPIRPCDVRAIRWKDVHRTEGYIAITNHFSGSEMTRGRKSSKKTFRIPITEEMEEILEALPKGIGEAPLFPSPRGRFCSENNLQRAWNRAMALTELPHVELYVGTKTAIMTDLGSVHSKAEMALVSGINEQTTDKYNLQSQRVNLIKAKEILERRRRKD